MLHNIQDEEKLRWSFRLYDMDNNGVIDIEEMVVIIETLDSIEGVKPGDTNVERKIKSPKVWSVMTRMGIRRRLPAQSSAQKRFSEWGKSLSLFAVKSSKIYIFSQ